MSFEAVFAAIGGTFVALFNWFGVDAEIMSGREFAGCGVMLVAILLSQVNFPAQKKL